MITARDMKELKSRHKNATFLCYVNTSAKVKAECDLCCTSANAESMVRDLAKKGGMVVFVPDKHLAGYAAEKTGCDIVPYDGFCPTHARIRPEDVREQKRLHPAAVVLAHPECPSEVRALADKVVSTEIMCLYARDMKSDEFIITTEVGIIHRLRRENPGKRFYPASEEAICPNMKLNTLEKVLRSLEDMSHQITLPRDTMHRARKCIRRMLEYRA
jgi:quinolinate synthase